MDGGENGNNPVSYTVESETITLDGATKDGYVFEGWYDNAEFEGDAITEISSGTFGDIELFASFFEDVTTNINANNKSVNFYPNPAVDIINVNGKETTSIYSLDGTLEIFSSASKIDVSSLESGVYVIKQGNKTAKFIKE